MSKRFVDRARVSLRRYHRILESARARDVSDHRLEDLVAEHYSYDPAKAPASGGDASAPTRVSLGVALA